MEQITLTIDCVIIKEGNEPFNGSLPSNTKVLVTD